jgi:hypothetical protein
MLKSSSRPQARGIRYSRRGGHGKSSPVYFYRGLLLARPILLFHQHNLFISFGMHIIREIKASVVGQICLADKLFFENSLNYTRRH